MSNAFFLVDQLAVVVAPILAGLEAGTLAASGPWRPSEWARPALTSITVPTSSLLPGTPSSQTDAFGNPLPAAPGYQGSTILVFDSVLKIEHARDLRRTEHPIQTSSGSATTSVTDHAYQLPAKVTLEIGMSDAMDSYSPAMWTGNVSKSVSAYQTLLQIQTARALVKLTTRLATYSNMILESIRPSDSEKTRYGLRATIVFSQIYLAQNLTSASAGAGSVSAPSNNGGTLSGSLDYGSSGGVVSAGSQDVSSRPSTTDSTSLGTVQTSTVPPSIETQNFAADAQASSVPGAGNWSSVNISQLGNL